MIFLSLGARLLVNVEALNMVESIGNVSRHRRATIIVHNGIYRKMEVPVISGESLAHAYQESLVLVAKQMYPDSPPICEWCVRGEFFKSMDTRHTMSEIEEKIKKIKRDIDQVKTFEEEVIKNCLIEDIGGFLRAEKPPVKRTSRFQVGYLIPALDAIESTSIESQFHVRHAPSEAVRAKAEEGEKRPAAAQMIYYIETGSALYSLSFNLDVTGIGQTSMVEIADVLKKEEKERRIKVALGALITMLSNKFFGAKRTRFLPIIEPRSVCAAVSSPLPFTVMPSTTRDFISQTKEKADYLNKTLTKLGIVEDVKIYAYSKEAKIPKGVVEVASLEEVLGKVTEDILGRIK